MATHSGILAWRIPRTEEFGKLQFIVSQRVRHPLKRLSKQQVNHSGFPGGSVTKNPCAKCRRCGFDPCRGTEIPHATVKTQHSPPQNFMYHNSSADLIAMERMLFPANRLYLRFKSHTENLQNPILKQAARKASLNSKIF